MARKGVFSGFDQFEVERLKQAGYHSVDELWRELQAAGAQDAYSELTRQARLVNISAGRLAALLAVNEVPHPRLKRRRGTEGWSLAEWVAIAIPAFAVVGFAVKVSLWAGWVMWHMLTMWLR